MDAKKTIWVKENETNEVCTEPGSTVQVDPSNVEVKEELLDNVNRECLQVPLVLSGSTDYIKEDPELNLEAEGTEKIVLTAADARRHGVADGGRRMWRQRRGARAAGGGAVTVDSCGGLRRLRRAADTYCAPTVSAATRHAANCGGGRCRRVVVGKQRSRCVLQLSGPPGTARRQQMLVSSQRHLSQSKRITTEQRAFMLDFMIKHPALATGRLAAKQKEQLLRKLAAMLNGLPNGVSKSKDKWFKSWQDWKSDVKVKASTLKKEMKKTGGIINSNAKPLTPLEKQLLNFLGPCVTSGHEEIPDPLTITHQDSGHESNTQSDRDKEDCIEVKDYDASDCDSSEDLLRFPPEGSTLPAPDVSPHLASAKGSVPSSQGGTSTREDDPLMDITRQQLICQQEQNAIRREQLLLDERKTCAIETAAAAFAGAMKALEEYLKHKRDNH